MVSKYFNIIFGTVMILISRFLTYIVPVLYFVFSLLWLVNPNLIYYSGAILILVLTYQVYLILRKKFDWFVFIKELFKPLLLLFIAQIYITFTPRNWEYLILTLLFTVIFYYVLVDLFNRFNPYLTKFSLRTHINLIYRVATIFFMLVVAYNFIIYLNWQWWIVLLASLFIILTILVITTENKIDAKTIIWFVLIILINAELIMVLYFLPTDVYLKSLLITLNFLYLTQYWQNRLKIIER